MVLAWAPYALAVFCFVLFCFAQVKGLDKNGDIVAGVIHEAYLPVYHKLHLFPQRTHSLVPLISFQGMTVYINRGQE